MDKNYKRMLKVIDKITKTFEKKIKMKKQHTQNKNTLMLKT